MATVPELKATAKDLGITGYSRMTKPELIAAIDAKRALIDETVSEALPTPESASNEISTPTPTDPRAERREAARLAGSYGRTTTPISSAGRKRAYRYQNGTARLTPAQAKRDRKKNNRARGFNGCTLAQYREVKRRMRKAGMV